MKKMKAEVRIKNYGIKTYFYKIFIYGITNWNESFKPYTTKNNAIRAAKKLCDRLNLDYKIESRY